MQKRIHLAIWNQQADFWEVGLDIFGRSAAYSETLPKSGMTHAGQLYELVTSEHRTAAPECSSLPMLPTPQYSDYKRENSPGELARKSPNITATQHYFPH